MRLHVVRHGETRHNVEERIQGDLLDDGLNAVGRQQADALHHHYASARARGLRVAAVYASPLRRATETAARIAEALDLPAPIPLPGVREVSWGVHMGHRNVGATRDDMVRVLTAWDAGDLSASAPGGETPAAAWARAHADVEPLLARHLGEDVVLVAHGRINKILLAGLLHGDLRHMDRYSQANASIHVLEGPTPWRLLEGDATRHLGPLPARDERH